MSSLWEAASLPSGVAVARATRFAGAVLAVGSLLGFVGGWPWAASIAIGGAVVLAVLWASVRVLIAGARRSSPVRALGLAVGIYLVTVVGLFFLAASTRSGTSDDGPIRTDAVAYGALGVLAAWTVALVVVHVRHDRPRGARN